MSTGTPSADADEAGATGGAPAALAGLLVADFSRVLAGPLATMTLADLGADVVKVERPGTGDETRSWGPPYAADGTATYYLSVNRNKLSLTLDLADPPDRELARVLCRRADVVVENFIPGTMARHGLDYPELRQINPGLVYASLTGFGPDSTLPGYDFLIQAAGGLMSLTGTPDGEPTKVGVALVDVLAGILAALVVRERTGAGQLVQVNLLSSLLAALVNQASGYLSAGVVPGRLGNRHPSIAPYQTFATGSVPIAVAVGTDAQYARFATAIGVPAEPRFATNQGRVRHREHLIEVVTRCLADRDASEWITRLRAAGVACGPVNTVAQGFALAESLDLRPVVPAGAVPSVRSPIGLTATPPRYRSGPPRLGEHSAALRGWLADGGQGPIPAG